MATDPLWVVECIMIAQTAGLALAIIQLTLSRVARTPAPCLLAESTFRLSRATMGTNTKTMMTVGLHSLPKVEHVLTPCRTIRPRIRYGITMTLKILIEASSRPVNVFATYLVNTPDPSMGIGWAEKLKG